MTMYNDEKSVDVKWNLFPRLNRMSYWAIVSGESL